MSGDFGGDSPSPYGPRPSPPPSLNPYQSAAGLQHKPLKPHRGSAILGLGISGVVVAIFGSLLAMLCYICLPLFVIPMSSLLLTIPAWVMGRNDLAEIDNGLMDPAGRGATMTGMIAGIVGVAILGASALLMIGLIVLRVVMIGWQAANQ